MPRKPKLTPEEKERRKHERKAAAIIPMGEEGAHPL